MSDPTGNNGQIRLTMPPEACNDAGELLLPDVIPIDVLTELGDIARFAESVADLTQTECTVLRWSPEEPVFLTTEAESRFVHAPICSALCAMTGEGCTRCARDTQAVAMRAMTTGRPETGSCLGGKDTLFACPIVLHHGGSVYPKAAIVAAAHDVFRFHFADHLSEVVGRPLDEIQQLLCQTDQNSLNARQLRRIRTIMETQASSFTRQITERYAELESLAVIAAQRDELTDAYAELDHEYKLVGRLQRALVPSTLPSVPGYHFAVHYHTARRAGGDYFDFFPLGDDRCGLIVADVSGHGPPAAVIMAVLRATMHAVPVDMNDPAAVADYANEQLCANAQGEHFTTGFYGVLTPDGRYRFACCGHPDPLRYDALTGHVKPIPCNRSGLPMGVIDDLGYTTEELSLEPGDVLVLYTDGITEAFNPVGEMFGEERLRAAIASNGAEGARAVRDAVLRALRGFCAEGAFQDDQTLVVIHRAAE